MNFETCLEFISGGIQNVIIFYLIFSPAGKPMAQHLLCCHGLAVKNYNFALGAAKLLHPRLLQR